MIRPINEWKKSAGELANYLGAENSADFEFSGITSNSNEIQAGDLFVALPGAKNHGANFVDQAKSSGAVAVLTDTNGKEIVGNKLPVIVIQDPRKELGVIASWFYEFPSRSLSLVGITGTNGKTTTSSLLDEIWRYAQKQSALIGTTGIAIGGENFQTTFTTPEAASLAAIFATTRERNISLTAMEVSSHAIELNRIKGTHFKFVGFTNLTQDHLDFHGDIESYFKAKARLFDNEYAELGFINIDDEYGAKLFKIAAIPVIGLSKSDRKAQWYFESIVPLQGGYEVAIRGTGGILIEGKIYLIGEHNLDNLLMASAMAFESGIDPLVIGNSFAHLVGAPGRLEQVAIGQKYLALVDYAHTPDAVARVLAALRAQIKGKIIAVLGCGGDRDRTKRPLMGRELLNGSDLAIFTSDNPRSEDPNTILNEMVSGLEIRESDCIVLDRREAIALAVANAADGDCVILLGKGHEVGQEISGVKYPFDDRIELARAIEELG